MQRKGRGKISHGARAGAASMEMIVEKWTAPPSLDSEYTFNRPKNAVDALERFIRFLYL
jgi:hypothetical protein